ncbi:PQQ-binding-like beta-propeller repeat protein [Nannocystis sp. ILAH1]|uniref:outer membrane protein assembly factor BamB family protein n=1 Tax=Nannocystis sp. ILAH1 TaxID=2996789 RepID=UPI00226D75E1|nr:PQQ-binding-like beta-propeller repeat protein [Nannocystis sp. ILAH1]MCY0987718.1 PQQ-binding-like beta-propeller repeat protein [Nannocystis sp. ILAH1]
MKSRALCMIAGALVLTGACGPKSGDESASASESSGESSTEGTGGSGTTEEPGPTTGEPTTGEPTTGESTTGLPADCPEGQEHLAPLWTAEFEPSPMSFGFYSGMGPIGRMADGRIVVAMNFQPTQEQSGLALLLFAPDGALLGPQTAALGTSPVEVHVLRIGADDQPLVLAEHFDTGDGSIHKLTRFSADMEVLSQIELVFPSPDVLVKPVMAVAGDVLAVAGHDAQLGARQVARLAPDTGAPLWKRELAGPGDLIPRQIAIGPQGDVAVAAHADFVGDEEDTLRLWRFDAGGAPIWDRVITVPVYEDITALHFAPGDQLVVLRGTVEFSTRAELLSVEVATGETRWELTVAEPEGDMTAWAQDMLVDGDGFTIPVSRSKWHHDIQTSTHTLELRKVSLAGELLAVDPLPGVLVPDTTSWVRSLRGRCGELILLESFSDLRMFAFAR